MGNQKLEAELTRIRRLSSVYLIYQRKGEKYMENKQIESLFYRPEKLDCSEFEQIIKGMRLYLTRLAEGIVETDELRSNVAHLIGTAIPLRQNPNMVFWGFDEPGNMPSDSRALYFYRPTYIVTAILMQSYLQDSDLVNCVPGLEETLTKAILASTGRGFDGGGYFMYKGMAEALEIFTEGGALSFMEKRGDLCEEFQECFYKAAEQIRDVFHGTKNIYPYDGIDMGAMEEVLPKIFLDEKDVV